MKKLIASLIAVAFLLTGSVVAANAGTTVKAASTARPTMSTHAGHKLTAKKPVNKLHKTNKANKTHKPTTKTHSTKPPKKTAGK